MTRAAFYDLDGTLASCNVVTRYAFFAIRHPSKARAILKHVKLVLSVPLLLGIDYYSRRLFNEYFYREYRGLQKDWLERMAVQLFDGEIRPAIYPGAKPLVDADRAEGYRLVLVTGALDFELPPLVRYFGFDDVICNSLVWENGVATGEIRAPLIAESEKRAAIERLCGERNIDPAQSKAYADSFADVALLESVGHPAAVHPDRRLRRVAVARAWPVLDLKRPVP